MKNNNKQTKIVRSKAFKLGLSIFAGVAAIGATCGLAVGLCSTANTDYVDINPYNETQNKEDYATGTKEKTTWNATEVEPTTSTPTMDQIKNSGDDNYGKRFNYSEVIGNGPDTSILDKSFQQSGYYAQTYWVHKNDPLLDGPHGTIGTNWDWEKPSFNYDYFALDDLSLTNSNNYYDSEGKFSSSSQKPSGMSNTDFVNTYKSAYDIGKKVLLLPGFQHISPIDSLKKSDPSTFNSMGFILVDCESPNNNVASLQFKAEQSAFLSGIATCQYLEENWEDIYSKVNSGQLAIGAFGGQDINTVTDFIGGLELGIWFYDTYCLPGYLKENNITDEAEIAKRTVKFISLGKKASYFSGTFVIGDAKLLAQELLAKGACAIMAVAGPQTGDVVSEIVAQKSPCRVIGVDSAMENGDWGKYYSTSPLFKEQTKVVLCSAEKNIAQLAAQVLDNIWKGNRVVYPIEENNTTTYKKLDDGSKLDDIGTEAIAGTDFKSWLGAVGSIGYTSVGNLYNNGVNLSTAGQDYLVRAVKLINKPNWQAITNYTEAIEAITEINPADDHGQRDPNKGLPAVTVPGKTLENGYTIAEIIAECHYFIY